MSTPLPNRLDSLKSLVEQLGLRYAIDTEVLAVLQEYSQRIYALEQDNRRMVETVRKLNVDLDAEKRRSREREIIVGDLRRTVGSRQ